MGPGFRGAVGPGLGGAVGPGFGGAVGLLSAMVSIVRSQSKWVAELVIPMLHRGCVPPTSCLTVPWGS